MKKPDPETGRFMVCSSRSWGDLWTRHSDRSWWQDDNRRGAPRPGAIPIFYGNTGLGEGQGSWLKSCGAVPARVSVGAGN